MNFLNKSLVGNRAEIVKRTKSRTVMTPKLIKEKVELG